MARQTTRATVARHGQQRTPTPIGQLLSLVSIGLVTVLVAGLGIAGWIFYDLSSTYTADAVDLGGEHPPGFTELVGGANILIAGTDNCEPEYADLFGDRCSDAGSPWSAFRAICSSTSPLARPKPVARALPSTGR